MAEMTFAIGNLKFDHSNYDRAGDVLYLRIGEPSPAADVYGTPEGYAVRFDEEGSIIGITMVNARWLVEQEGKITITVPSRIETSATEVGPLLAGA